MMSAYVKIPLQALILLTGVIVFVYYLFVQPPMLFDPVHDRAEDRAPRRKGARRSSGGSTRRLPIGARRRRPMPPPAHGQSFDHRADAPALSGGRRPAERDSTPGGRSGEEGLWRRTRTTTSTTCSRRSSSTQMPPGLIGLIIAAIFAAAMSSIAAELNSLSTATLIDFYKRHLKPEATDKHYMTVSWVATAVWGVIACGVAIFATNLGSLIEVVNRSGRSSTDRCSVCSSWPSARGAPRAPVRSSASSAACPPSPSSPSAIRRFPSSGTTSSASSSSWWWEWR